jgi:hypothetical protein
MTIYVPDSVTGPAISFSPEERTMYWVGFQRAVREVYNLVKDTMEPPPAPKPQEEGKKS